MFDSNVFECTCGELLDSMARWVEALLGQEGRLTRELLLELPDQSCCLLLLLCLLKPLALELR